jgi:hypothetical protein
LDTHPACARREPDNPSSHGGEWRRRCLWRSRSAGKEPSRSALRRARGPGQDRAHHALRRHRCLTAKRDAGRSLMAARRATVRRLRHCHGHLVTVIVQQQQARGQDKLSVELCEQWKTPGRAPPPSSGQLRVPRGRCSATLLLMFF